MSESSMKKLMITIFCVFIATVIVGVIWRFDELGPDGALLALFIVFTLAGHLLVLYKLNKLESE